MALTIQYFKQGECVMCIYEFGGHWHLGGRFEYFVVAKNLKGTWEKLANSKEKTIKDIKGRHSFIKKLRKDGLEFRIKD